VVLVQLHKSN